ncbi:MAG TPA: aldo/keto reductase [Acidimicrobiales bacterium]|jgi:aryl-alcohol dehydrogenase-like predicted oxidoreductase|nr:aldo/keto reductase [Acidimicrobiales bacterium]
MEFRTLGRSGLKVSVAGLGCNNFGMRIDEDRTREVLFAALDAGINFFDTARMYGGGKSEEFMGRVLRGRRDECVLATKFGGSRDPSDAGGSRRHILRSVEISLRLLDTDHIDLLQLHYPDTDTPIDETLSALTTLVQQGKVRYIGCSNFAGWQVADAHWISETKHLESFVSVQNEWNLLNRSLESEVKPACQRFGCSILPFFPLASGMLTGKVRRGEQAPEGSRLNNAYFASSLNDTNFDKLERLEAWAREHDRTITEVALSWLASQPVVGSVIAGATSAEQVKINAESTKTDLTAAEVAEIGELVGR